MCSAIGLARALVRGLYFPINSINATTVDSTPDRMAGSGVILNSGE